MMIVSQLVVPGSIIGAILCAILVGISGAHMYRVRREDLDWDWFAAATFFTGLVGFSSLIANLFLRNSIEEISALRLVIQGGCGAALIPLVLSEALLIYGIVGMFCGWERHDLRFIGLAILLVIPIVGIGFTISLLGWALLTPIGVILGFVKLISDWLEFEDFQSKINNW